MNTNHLLTYTKNQTIPNLKLIKTLQGKENGGLSIQGIDDELNIFINEGYGQDGSSWFYKLDLNGIILEEIFDEVDHYDPHWEGLDPNIIPFNSSGKIVTPSPAETRFPFFILPKKKGMWLGPISKHEQESLDTMSVSISDEIKKIYGKWIADSNQPYDAPQCILSIISDYTTSEIKLNPNEFLIIRKLIFLIERKKEHHSKNHITGEIIKNATVSVKLLQHLKIDGMEFIIDTWKPGLGIKDITSPSELVVVDDHLFVNDSVGYKSEKNKIHIFSMKEFFPSPMS